jgi:hypothetical protein
MTTRLKRLAACLTASAAMPVAALVPTASPASAAVKAPSATSCPVLQPTFPSGDNYVLMTNQITGERILVEAQTISTFSGFSGYITAWVEQPGQTSFSLAGGTPIGRLSIISISTFSIMMVYSFAEGRYAGQVPTAPAYGRPSSERQSAWRWPS